MNKTLVTISALGFALANEVTEPRLLQASSYETCISCIYHDFYWDGNSKEC